MKSLSIKEIAVAGLIAAVYAVLTAVLAPISYGVYQIRVSEALTVLPALSRAAIPGLFVGCLVANLIGGNGWMDIVFGSLITLVAALATRGLYCLFEGYLGKGLAPLPPVLFNAFGVSAYLAPIIGVNYWTAVLWIGGGQLASCYLLGLPLLLILEKRKTVLF